METLRNLSGVINVVLGSGAYESVSMPSTLSCKAITVKTREAASFTISAGSAGDTCFSIGSNDVLSMDLAKNPEELIFWAKADSGTPTLEILLFNF